MALLGEMVLNLLAVIHAKFIREFESTNSTPLNLRFNSVNHYRTDSILDG